MTLKRSTKKARVGELARLLETWMGEVGGADGDWAAVAGRLMAVCEADEREALKRSQGARPRWDYGLIEKLVHRRSSVLDLGCGTGELLARLIQDKGRGAACRVSR